MEQIYNWKLVIRLYNGDVKPIAPVTHLEWSFNIILSRPAASSSQNSASVIYIYVKKAHYKIWNPVRTLRLVVAFTKIGTATWAALMLCFWGHYNTERHWSFLARSRLGQLFSDLLNSARIFTYTMKHHCCGDHIPLCLFCVLYPFIIFIVYSSSSKCFTKNP